jgi:hypothetical protein
MPFSTPKPKPRPRFVLLDGKPPAKPRGRHAGKPANDERRTFAIPVNQRLGYRVSEWAALTGSSTATVWRHVRSGRIETVKQGSVTLIPRRFAIRAGYIDA